MSIHQLSAFIPIACGVFLLYCAFSKDPSARVLKPTLAILSFSGLVYGLLVLLLDESSFRAYVGTRIAAWLMNFKFFVGGTGAGAVVCSLFYGHWKTAWLEKKKCHQNEIRQT